MSILEDISSYLQEGRMSKVKELVQQALDEGIAPLTILEDGLIAGMNVIGEQFKNNEVFVPEVLVSARAMNAGAAVLKPHLSAGGEHEKGVAIIGTVKGDLHDIGKNLVRMMMESKGIVVHDLGVDVSAEQFVDAAIEHNADLICCSSLLASAMGEMKNVIKVAEERGIRDKVKIMVGGAPVTQDFANHVGADCYTPDATTAAEAAVALCVG